MSLLMLEYGDESMLRLTAVRCRFGTASLGHDAGQIARFRVVEYSCDDCKEYLEPNIPGRVAAVPSVYRFRKTW